MGNRVPPAAGRLDETMLVWNGVVSRIPALAIEPSTVDEVAAAVAFARDHGLRVRVEGLGRRPAGASPERAVTLNLSRMRSVSVDAGSGLAHAGPGCPRRVVERAAAARAFSVAALVEVEVVTDDGLVLSATKKRNAGLFRAVTTDTGAELGIVTRLTWQLRRRSGR
jgi:hypothetical protein